MSVSSKHRRVKSLVREIESGDVVLPASTSASSLSNLAGSANGSPSSATAPATLHTRASTSSLSSQASGATGNTPSTPDTIISPTSTLSRKASGGYSAQLGNNNNNRYLDYGNMASGNPAGGNSAKSGYRSTSDSQYLPLDTPALEEMEADDVFLPLSSPFSPNYSMNGSSNGSSMPNSPRRNSRLDMGPPPSSSQQMTAAERREHSRKNSTIHTRNLSVFFPRPEQKGLPGYQEHGEEDEGHNSVAVDIPGAETRGWGFTNNVNKAYTGQPQKYRETAEEAQSQANARRGHHHRHSMSHNFFPFIDTSSPGRKLSNSSLSPNQPATAKSPFSPSGGSAHTPHSATSLSTPRSVPALSSSTSRHRHTTSDPSLIPSISLRSKYSHFPAPARLVLAVVFHLPILTQIALLAAVAEVGLGASLWVGGQAGESLAVTGLGYLVVFDALAALSSVIIEGNARGTERLWDIMQGRRAADNGVRYPFGTSRVTTLSHFAQCVYLLFSAVYVCKESIEHVLLLHGPDEEGPDGMMGDASHGAAHGTMGHGEGIAMASSGGSVFEWEDMGVLIPTKLLTLSMVACLFTAIALQNHASLTEAVGSTTYSLRPRLAPGANKSRISTVLHNSILSNPFTLTVLVFSFALATASLLIPAQQLAPLDKVVALLQSIAMFYIAYPAAVATGKVLLQTAPMAAESGGGEMNALRRTLEEIENHPSVVYLPPPHIWQLTPHPPPVPAPSSSKPSSFGRRSLAPSTSSSADPTTTIITLNVQVKQDASEQEILDLTSWSREKCLIALLGAGANQNASNGAGSGSGKNRQRQVELTVQVMRFEEARALQAETDHSHGHSHGGHDHGHDHSHGHGHGHHDHDHGHGHEHSHSPAHDHGHAGHSHSSHDGGHSHHAHQDGHGHSPAGGHDHDHGHSSHSHSHDHGSNNHGHHH